jgi:hypothetical protein
LEEARVRQRQRDGTPRNKATADPSMTETDRRDARLAHFFRSAGRLEVAEHRQRVLRAASERMETLRLGSDDADELFYDAFRESLLLADATEADISAVVDMCVRIAVESTVGQPGKRHELLQSIAEHLACTEIDVHFHKDDTVTRVEFPDRPKVN